MNKFFFGILLALFAMFSSVGSVAAWEFRTGENINLGPKDNIKESVMMAGGNLNVANRIEGDLICAGKKIVISGEVTGDVICAGQNITIKGRVGGNVRLAGQNLSLQNFVARNVTLLGQELSIEKGAVISGDLYTASQSLDIQGRVAKTWAANGQSINLNGRIDGSAKVDSDSLVLGENAVLVGKLSYTSSNEAQVASGAKLMQGSERTAPVERVNNSRFDRNNLNKVAKGFGMASKVMGIVFGLIFGLIVVLLFPTWTEKVAKSVWTDTGRKALVGLLLWMVLPILIVLCAITIVGIPLAIFMGMSAVVFGMLTKVVASVAIGARILEGRSTKLILIWFVGTIVLSVIDFIPVVGWFVSLLAGLIATGAIKNSIGEKK